MASRSNRHAQVPRTTAKCRIGAAKSGERNFPSGQVSTDEVPRSTATSQLITRIQAHAHARTRARNVGTSIPPSRSSDGNSEHHVRPAPSAQVTTLKHCRCVDCLFWRAAPVSECRHGTIRNGIGDPEYPPNAWHYCALYHGPQISLDVWTQTWIPPPS